MLPVLLLALPAFLWREGTVQGIDDYYYIIRSDLGLYMRSTNFHEVKDIHIFTLHNSVRGGDHYLSHKDDLFYIIKGDSYRRVTNLNKDSAAVVYTLHPNCRKGDHYFSAGDYFYIIFKAKRIVRRVTNMHEDTRARTFPIHSALKNGLYYWGTASWTYCVKGSNKWGVKYQRTTNFEKNTNPITYSFHGDVVNFLPGGVAVTFGKSFSLWQRVSVIVNEASTNVTQEYSITRKVGYVKEKTKTIERNWKVSASATVGTGELALLLVQAQFSLETSFGGSNVDTTSEPWSAAIEITDKITFTVSSKQSIYVWQYKMGLGKEDILYSHTALAFTNTAVPPAFNPYEPAKK
ncbi:hypothetical protein JRQ81_004292 [Phrynocephalus forsythii]|uniref:Uncharacterized protein n=1 Tax=Phrynocephalus forsythii TaxID=171643 RepID=A0A9Q0XFG8_9SAUR|nr:hypothetical protein JRQ81_004292 [Phrynocephalus forsythii]